MKPAERRRLAADHPPTQEPIQPPTVAKFRLAPSKKHKGQRRQIAATYRAQERQPA